MTEPEERTVCCGLVRRMLREDWPLLLLFAVALVVAVALYPSLPARVPTHWNIRGEVDQWSPKAFGVFGLLGLNVGIYFLLLVVPLFDPKGENYAKFRSTYRALRWMFGVVMTAIWGVALAAARGAKVDVSIVVPVLVSLMFVGFGNLMGRVRYNWFVGIRTPWSLANETAWRMTHRVAGKAWVLGGLISLVGAFFGGTTAAVAMGIGVGGAGIFSVAYSYFAWRRSLEGGAK